MTGAACYTGVSAKGGKGAGWGCALLSLFNPGIDSDLSFTPTPTMSVLFIFLDFVIIGLRTYSSFFHQPTHTPHTVAQAATCDQRNIYYPTSEHKVRMVKWLLDPSRGFYTNNATRSLNAQVVDGCDALFVACLYRNALVVKAPEHYDTSMSAPLVPATTNHWRRIANPCFTQQGETGRHRGREGEYRVR